MSDQLSLRLETDLLPDLPDLRPMLPRPLPEAFDSDEHLFEPWWGGRRVLVGIGPADLPGTGEVRVVDADGADLSAAFPELAGMAVRVAARSALLDGELVVVDAHGRADAAALEARFAGEQRPAGGVPRLRRARPRRAVAARACRSSSGARRSAACSGRATRCVAVPAIATEGRALYDAAVAQGIAGDPRAAADEPVPAGRPQPPVALRGGHPGECRRRRRVAGADRRLRPRARADQPAAAGRRRLAPRAQPARRAAAMNVRIPGRCP